MVANTNAIVFKSSKITTSAFTSGKLDANVPNFQFQVESSREIFRRETEILDSFSSISVVKKRQWNPTMCTFRSRATSAPNVDFKKKEISPPRSETWRPGPSTYIGSEMSPTSKESEFCCIDPNYIVGGFAGDNLSFKPQFQLSSLNNVPRIRNFVEKIPLRSTNSLPTSDKLPERKVLTRSVTNPIFSTTKVVPFTKTLSETTLQPKLEKSRTGMQSKTICKTCQKALNRATKRRRIKNKWKFAARKIRTAKLMIEDVEVS